MHIDVSLDASPDEISTIGDRPHGGRRPWRRAVEPLLLVAAVATAIALTNVAQPRDPPAPRRPAPPALVSPTAAPARSIDTPRFVVPLIASPGEQIAVVAFRDRCLAELRREESEHGDRDHGRPAPAEAEALA